MKNVLTILLIESLLTVFIIKADYKDNGFILITSLFNETNETRIQEYITCLERNLNHPLISTIHILYDTSKDDSNTVLLNYLKTHDIEISYISGRPSFADCFKLANNRYPNRRIILCNADIFFNETLNVLDTYDLTNEFLALTRWNVLPDGSMEIFKQYDKKNCFKQSSSERSQDVWIFQTPIGNIDCDQLFLGTWGCDCRIAYEAAQAGFKLINPCLSVQCCHLHLSEVRNYKKAGVDQSKTAQTPWCSLDESSSAGSSKL